MVLPWADFLTISRLTGETPDAEAETSSGVLYWGSMVGFFVIAVFVILAFVGSLTAMVDFATIISFLTAPVLGYFNLKAVTS